jgi:hypothetical protein
MNEEAKTRHGRKRIATELKAGELATAAAAAAIGAGIASALGAASSAVKGYMKKKGCKSKCTTELQRSRYDSWLPDPMSYQRASAACMNGCAASGVVPSSDELIDASKP